MHRTNRSLRDTFPEIDELIAFKNFIFSLLSRQDNQTKQKAANFFKTFLNVFKLVLRSLLPALLYCLMVWLMLWGLWQSLKFFLNPLGLENYF